MHGRTRACRFEGDAEYDTIRAIVAAVRIPVIANGDIATAAKAAAVLAHTGAAAVMIGRAAQGAPVAVRRRSTPRCATAAAEQAPPRARSAR